MPSSIEVSAGLQERFSAFLEAFRLGIDLGEHAGGIALVQRNRILHAETYLDFHTATLEVRRRLRRGRRTRHAKQMRLARLRSWVLRQRLPDGTRLPDPKNILRDKRLWPAPGTFQANGANPLDGDSWIGAVAEGKESTPEAFVRALTLIFRKRGYKYDPRDLHELSDADLADFLGAARITDEGVAAEIEQEIGRRETNPDDPVRGRRKRKPAELRALLDEARRRQPAPRVAEPRQSKEGDLRRVVEGFGRSRGLGDKTIKDWQNQLAGSRDHGDRHVGLLNKVLRPARFENRVRSGCSWCGRTTPRKSKLREYAYRAAIHNLRADRGRLKLAREHRDELLAWYGAAQKPGLATIKTRLRKLGAKTRMARQLYDLLNNPNAKGRASLCAEHLKMAAEGRTMKDAGVEWQTVAPRRAPNPARQQHDERVVARLESVLFKPGGFGDNAWRFGPVSFITLEVPEPRTERPGKGEQKERQQLSHFERLKNETGNRCVYCVGLGESQGKPPAEEDHIFPRSRGGPDIRENLVPACAAHNKEKGNRTPYEWLGPNARWKSFGREVRGLGLSDRKAALLLSTESEYPDNPTPLAHVGARPREFVKMIGKLFEEHGVAAPTLDYRLGRPHIQRSPGWLTERLRRSWMYDGEEAVNFPPKCREDLYSHAQDAALLAALPPHTWRERIFCVAASRPTASGGVKPVPGLALPALAPDWAGFEARLHERGDPLVRALGRYKVSWKTGFADETFARSPWSLDDEKQEIYKPLTAIGAKEVEKVLSDEVRVKLGELRQRLGLSGKKTFPQETLRQHFPGRRRVRVSNQKGGLLVKVTPHDGPARKVQIKPASEGVVVWEKDGKAHLSLIRPRPLRIFGIKRVDPPLPPGAKVLGRLSRHQVIRDPKKGELYRLTKFQAGGVTAVPENAAPGLIDYPRSEEGVASRSKQIRFTAARLACCLKAREAGSTLDPPG